MVSSELCIVRILYVSQIVEFSAAHNIKTLNSAIAPSHSAVTTQPALLHFLRHC